MGGPATSGYPGTPAMVLIIAACAGMIVKSSIHGYKAKRNKIVPNGAAGYVPLAVIASFLFVMAIISVIAHFRSN